VRPHRDEATEAARLGYKGPSDSKVQIVIGAKETLETKQMKDELKKRWEDGSFLDKIKEGDKNLDKLELSRKEIVYNLNLIVPENLRDIEKDILPYLFESEIVCQTLIDEIIKKAWDQPKYASTYAKLCYDFSKKAPSDFESKKEKENPFKFLLIQNVQHSFDEKL
jgi:hypothetical protein